MTDAIVSAEMVVKAAARDWLLRFQLSKSTPADRAEFEAWRAEDARHDAAYRRFEGIWRDSAALTELESLVPAPVSPRRSRWRSAWVAGGAALAASLATAVVVLLRSDLGTRLLPLSSGHYSTGVGQLRTLHLADGSTVTLGARSALDVNLGDRERQVSLTAGEVFFAVARDPLRPFVVAVGDRQVRVLGTAFEVRREGADMHVAVAEGAVEVVQPPTAAPAVGAQEAPLERRVLRAGEQVTASRAGAISVSKTTVEPATWRRGRLVYVDVPLKEVVADANRYSRTPITVADERIANLSVSVTYRTNRVDEMLGALGRSLHLSVERQGEEIVLKAGAENAKN